MIQRNSTNNSLRYQRNQLSLEVQDVWICICAGKLTGIFICSLYACAYVCMHLTSEIHHSLYNTVTQSVVLPVWVCIWHAHFWVNVFAWGNAYRRMEMLENARINVRAFFVAIPTTLPLQLCHLVRVSAGLCLHLFMHIYLSLYCIVNTPIKNAFTG